MTDILPCLKDYEWDGKDDSVARPLLADEQAAFIPWVAFGYEKKHTFEFLLRADLAKLGKDERELEREAIKHLQQRAGSWQPWDVKLSLFKKLKMLACGDDYLAAERILDPTFLQEAQRRLGAEGLLVGVPRRGALMVTDAFQDRDRVTAFLALVAQQYQEGSSPPVSPAAFTVSDGRIFNVIDTVARLVPAEQQGDDDEDEEDETYVSVMVATDESGRETPMVIAADSDFDRLANTLIQVITAIVADYLAKPNFSGEIEVVVSAVTPGVDENLPRLRAHLGGLVSELAEGTGHAVRITVERETDEGPDQPSS